MVRVFKWSFLDAVRDPINFIEDYRFLPRLEADEQYFTQSFESLYLFFCPRQLCSFFSHTPSITNGPPPPSHFLHSPSLGFHSEKVTPKKKLYINLTITESYKIGVLLHHGRISRGQRRREHWRMKVIMWWRRCTYIKQFFLYNSSSDYKDVWALIGQEFRHFSL